jgi:hypothetical protein
MILEDEPLISEVVLSQALTKCNVPYGAQWLTFVLSSNEATSLPCTPPNFAPSIR